MGTENRLSIKEIGGVEISSRGFSVWWSDDQDRHWTFRIGWASGIADVHETPQSGPPNALWVARTSELIGWLEQVFTLDAVAGWIDTIAAPVTWEWVRSQGSWLAPVPTFPDAERARLACVMAKVPLDEAMEREPSLVPSPLPLDLFPSDVKPGSYLAYPGPRSDETSLAMVIWTPGAAGRELLWIDPTELVGHADALLAPFRADLLAMDRPEVREAHRLFLERLRIARRANVGQESLSGSMPLTNVVGGTLYVTSLPLRTLSISARTSGNGD